jgi:hypothetical protein
MFVKSQDSQDIVTNASMWVLPGNNQRTAVAFTNPSTSIIWLAKGSVATLNQGILLNAQGGSYTDTRNEKGAMYTGVYSAIAVTAGSNILAAQEDYYEN